MDNEADKEYTLTVRLGAKHRRKLAAYADQNRMTLAEVIRCYINGLPDENEAKHEADERLISELRAAATNQVTRAQLMARRTKA